jgi:hypothetical protein
MVGGKTAGGLWIRPERTETRKSSGGQGKTAKRSCQKKVVGRRTGVMLSSYRADLKKPKKTGTKPRARPRHIHGTPAAAKPGAQ